MKLTCVTAVFNAIKSGNRENLIRCVKSVAALKTEHEHLIYDGASTDGTVELLRELEREINGGGNGKKVGGESRATADILSSSDAEGIPRLRVVSEPDTGIYNALNKGVRDAKGEWFYVLGCDDWVEHSDVMDQTIELAMPSVDVIASTVKNGPNHCFFNRKADLNRMYYHMSYCHQGVIMRTALVRSLGGYDEKYKICADFDMMLKAHEQGARFLYSFKQYAYFQLGGVSCDTGVECDVVEIVSHHFKVPKNLVRSRFERPIPLKYTVPFVFSRDEAFRRSARSMAYQRILYLARPLILITRPVRHKIKDLIHGQ